VQLEALSVLREQGFQGGGVGGEQVESFGFGTRGLELTGVRLLFEIALPADGLDIWWNG
jgi:hypothetical protein